MGRYIFLLVIPTLLYAQNPTREQTLAAMKKAAAFYKDKVSTHGGYHFTSTDDLSYGRSEHAETPHHVEVQREGTPRVGMAYLEAYDATKDPFFLEAARSVGHMLVQGQLCSGGWDYYTEFEPAERKRFPYRADNNCSPANPKGKPVTNLDDNVTQACTRLIMRIDKALNFSDKAIHDAARFALDSLVKAQYPIGAWPQRYSEFPDPAKFPVKKASAQHAVIRSALYQSALISTALPCRGVTTQSPTFASIHVNCVPAYPADNNPSAAST